jgi:hypothetical protein
MATMELALHDQDLGAFGLLNLVVGGSAGAGACRGFETLQSRDTYKMGTIAGAYCAALSS